MEVFWAAITSGYVVVVMLVLVVVMRGVSVLCVFMCPGLSARELEYVDVDLAGSPVCPGSRGWGQSRGDTWTGPDLAHRTRILWVLDIFQLDGVRQEGTAVVWEKGPTEASSGG